MSGPISHGISRDLEHALVLAYIFRWRGSSAIHRYVMQRDIRSITDSIMMSIGKSSIKAEPFPY
jgi:hypothetical protein